MCSDPEHDGIALVEAWRAGDIRAGQTLCERHDTCVARFFRNKVDCEAADLIQTTFLGCLEALDRLRGAASFNASLLAIAYFWEALSGPEIVVVLAAPEGTVRTPIRRARQQLPTTTSTRAMARSIADLAAWAERPRPAL